MKIEPTTDEAAIVHLLTSAFADDPGMRHLCQHEHSGYHARLSGWFRAMVRLQMANHQPLLAAIHDNEMVMCAILTAPQTTLKPLSLMRWMGATLSHVGIQGLGRTLHHLRLISQYQPTAPHFRMEFIAVAPAHQGKGYARILLDALHTRAKQHPDAIGIWLETANPANIPLYERFGYAVERCLPMADTVEACLMFRANSG